jgi:hypothetical protein
MLTTLLSILGGLGGAAMRLFPELFKLFTLKKDHDHEYRMTQLQLQIDQARAGQEIDKVYANQSLEAVRGEMAAYVEALRGQGKMTGVKWIDGLNQSVRPVVTYWWMSLLTLAKLITIVIAAVELYYTMKVMDTIMGKIAIVGEFPAKIWTPDDAGILSMILGFWFVDRAIKHMRR